MEFRSNNNNSSQNNCGLLRYRSAPISLVANFTNLTSGLSSDDTNTVNVMKKGDNGCSKAFFAMNSQLPPPYPRQDCGQGYFRAVSSIRMDYECQRKITNPQNGYRGSKLFASEGGATGDRLRNQTNFSSLGILSRISEVEHESGMPNGPNQAKVESKNGEKSPSRFGSWSNDYLYNAENFTGGIKREMNDDGSVFVGSQSRQPGNRSHHLSLPKTAAEIGGIEKFLHFQDIVPCKVRAKRGCATHPRSIAERVRRTRISERMRKLQDLVPNTDKQTNTADMLDFAVEYIKRLQKQYRALSEIRANCKCEGVSKSSTLN